MPADEIGHEVGKPVGHHASRREIHPSVMGQSGSPLLARGKHPLVEAEGSHDTMIPEVGFARRLPARAVA